MTIINPHLKAPAAPVLDENGRLQQGTYDLDGSGNFDKSELLAFLSTMVIGLEEPPKRLKELESIVEATVEGEQS